MLLGTCTVPTKKHSTLALQVLETYMSITNRLELWSRLYAFSCGGSLDNTSDLPLIVLLVRLTCLSFSIVFGFGLCTTVDMLLDIRKINSNVSIKAMVINKV